MSKVKSMCAGGAISNTISALTSYIVMINDLRENEEHLYDLFVYLTWSGTHAASADFERNRYGQKASTYIDARFRAIRMQKSVSFVWTLRQRSSKFANVFNNGHLARVDIGKNRFNIVMKWEIRVNGDANQRSHIFILVV